jgi:hypothetical protein
VIPLGTNATDRDRAEYWLERADYFANTDHWSGDRRPMVAEAIAQAQVHATLAVADATCQVLDYLREKP